MGKRLTLLWYLSLVTGIILFVLIDHYKETSEKIINSILLVACIMYVGGWLFDKILGIFVKTSENIPIEPKKEIIEKNENKKELTIIQFILFYPILTFGVMFLIGMVNTLWTP